jgi:hypothetical protein
MDRIMAGLENAANSWAEKRAIGEFRAEDINIAITNALKILYRD